jgi:hypothetical protein
MFPLIRYRNFNGMGRKRVPQLTWFGLLSLMLDLIVWDSSFSGSTATALLVRVIKIFFSCNKY